MNLPLIERISYYERCDVYDDDEPETPVSKLVEELTFSYSEQASQSQKTLPLALTMTADESTKSSQ
mgnify:CR=1 FL=1